MKAAVAVTLIIGGVVIIALPPLSDTWHSFMLTLVLEHANQGISVNLEGAMPDLYRFGCWLVGAVMIGVAIIASLIAFSETRNPRLAAIAG